MRRVAMGQGRPLALPSSPITLWACESRSHALLYLLLTKMAQSVRGYFHSIRPFHASTAAGPQLRRASFPVEPIVGLGSGKVRIAVMRLVVVPVHTYL